MCEWLFTHGYIYGLFHRQSAKNSQYREWFGFYSNIWYSHVSTIDWYTFWSPWAVNTWAVPLVQDNPSEFCTRERLLTYSLTHTRTLQHTRVHTHTHIYAQALTRSYTIYSNTEGSIIGASLSEPHIKHDNGPAHWIMVCIYLSMYHLPRVCSTQVPEICVRPEMLCIPVHWHAHVHDLQLHALDWTARTTGATCVCCEGYQRRQVGECADTWYKRIQPTETVEL